MSRSTIRAKLLLSGLIVVSLATGCGGGGGASESNPGGGNEPPAQDEQGTARFHVDVASGQVHVTNLVPDGRAVFAGGAISFQTTTLVDQPGDTGRKVLSVSMKNNLGETIGATPDGSATGFRVLFTSFTNFDLNTDLRSKTVASVLAGTGAPGYADGVATGGLLRKPSAIAVGSDGTVYFTDTDNNRIRYIRNGTLFTLAGSGASDSVDGAGNAASFKGPHGIAIAGDGALIVTEALGMKIRRVSLEGSVTTVAGSGKSGSGNGIGEDASFNTPEGICVAPDGTMYVCDSVNNKIRQISAPQGDPRKSDSYLVSDFVGSGAIGVTDGNGPAATFHLPRGIVIDDSDALYVTDRLNNRIRRISSIGEVTTIAGTGSGTAEGAGNLAQFKQVAGITLLGHNALAISEVQGNKIKQVILADGATPTNPANWIVTSISGTGASGKDNGVGTVAAYSSPLGIAFADGRLLVADSGNSKIRAITANVGFPVPVGTGSPTPELVRLASPDGTAPGLITYLDLPGSLAAGETSAARAWEFVVPAGVTAFEFTVKVEGNTEFQTGLAGTYVPGQSPLGSPLNDVRTIAGSTTSSASQDGNGLNARFSAAVLTCSDSSGNLFVADSNKIRRMTPDGQVTSVAGTNITGQNIDGLGSVAAFYGATGVACNPEGTVLYVACNLANKIRRISLTGSDPSLATNWMVTTIAGGSYGWQDGLGNQAMFSAPWGLAVSSNGILYVSESDGNRIRKLINNGGDPMDSANWTVSTLAGSTSGQAGYVDGSFGTRFDFPSGIAVDEAGNIFVADIYNYRIREISPAGIVTTFAGSGLVGSDDGVGTGAGIYYPQALAFDKAGYLYVAQSGCIRRISPTARVETIAGAASQTGPNDGNGGSARFWGPTGISVTPSGDLLVVDHNRIRKVSRILTN